MAKISVLITTYNRDGFLADAVDSVRAQTFSDWEAIIVDNGDSGFAKSLASRFQDRRIRYVKAPHNLGECAGRNLALSHSRGDYVCYLDDDDVLPMDSLERRFECYERYPSCGMVYGEYKVFLMDERRVLARNDVSTPIYYRKDYYNKLLEELNNGQEETLYFLKLFNFVRGGTPLIRRRTFDLVGRFDERLHFYGDYDMWLKIASYLPITFLDREVYHYRAHSGSKTFTIDAAQRMHYALVLCRTHNIRKSLQFASYQDAINRLWEPSDSPTSGGQKIAKLRAEDNCNLLEEVNRGARANVLRKEKSTGQNRMRQ